MHNVCELVHVLPANTAVSHSLPLLRAKSEVCLRVSYVVAGANERRLYSQASACASLNKDLFDLAWMARIRIYSKNQLLLEGKYLVVLSPTGFSESFKKSFSCFFNYRSCAKIKQESGDL